LLLFGTILEIEGFKLITGTVAETAILPARESGKEGLKMTGSKQGMREPERLEALLNRQRPDRVPLWPASLGYSVVNAGYTINEFYTDPRISTDAQIWANEQYGWLPVLLIPGPMAGWPALEFGGDVKWPESDFSQAPTVTRHPVQNDEDIRNLKIPDNLEQAGTIPLMLSATAYALKRQPEGLVIVVIGLGPMETGRALLSIEKLSRMFYKKPDLVHKVFRFVTDFQIAVARLWAEKFDPARICPFVGGPTHSNQVISPKMFRDFCLPYLKEQHAAYREMGYKHFFFHPCGEQNENLPFWAEVEMGDPGIISVGHEIDLAKVAEFFPDHIALGNLEPAIVQSSKPDDVYEATRELVLKHKHIPGGYIFSLGCELPPKAAAGRVWAMTRAVRDFGWYE
jgi:uroporphyrinogen decarboxylase